MSVADPDGRILQALRDRQQCLALELRWMAEDLRAKLADLGIDVDEPWWRQ